MFDIVIASNDHISNELLRSIALSIFQVVTRMHSFGVVTMEVMLIRTSHMVKIFIIMTSTLYIHM